MSLVRQYRNPFALKETPRWLIESRIRSGVEPYPHLTRAKMEELMVGGYWYPSKDELDENGHILPQFRRETPEIKLDRLRAAATRLTAAAVAVVGLADIPESALEELNAASVAVTDLLREFEQV